VTKFALFGALALVSAMAATPVTAQEVIYNLNWLPVKDRPPDDGSSHLR